MPDVELAVAVGDATADGGERVVIGASMIVLIIVLVITSTFRFSLFLMCGKLHGIVSKIVGSKHIGTPALPVVGVVGSTMAVLAIMVDSEFELEVTVIDWINVQTLRTGMLNRPTIGFSYQYVPEYVKLAGSGRLSVISPSILAFKSEIWKRGTANAEADVDKSITIVRKQCISRKVLEGQWYWSLISKRLAHEFYT